MASECLHRDAGLALYLKADSLSLSFGKDRVYTYDRDGRPLAFFMQGDFYQRSLGNTVLHKRREQGRRLRSLLPDPDDFLALRHQEVAALRLDNEEAQAWLARVLAWTPERLAEQSQRFRELYKPISILPPDQYLSLVVQLAEGCSYNRCSFCNFYKDRPFRIKPAAEFKAHLQAVRDFLGEAGRLRQGIFLADGDALMTPMPRLLESIGLIREQFPELPLYSFMDAFRPQAKTQADFETLAAQGLKRVYLGIETGDTELLAWLEKPGTPELMLTEARKMKAAGLGLGLILMVGVGGQRFAEAHRRASVAWLKALGPDQRDLVFLSEFVPHADQPYAEKAAREGVTALSATELELEVQTWRLALRDLKGIRAKIVPYHLQEFVY